MAARRRSKWCRIWRESWQGGDCTATTIANMVSSIASSGAGDHVGEGHHLALRISRMIGTFLGACLLLIVNVQDVLTKRSTKKMIDRMANTGN